MYLRKGIDKLFKIYFKLFNKRGIKSLEVLAKNESIDYENLSHKIHYFENDNARFHVVDFFRRLWYTL